MFQQGAGATSLKWRAACSLSGEGDKPLRVPRTFSSFVLACFILICAAAAAFAGGATIREPANRAVVSGAVPIVLAMAPRVSTASLYIDGTLFASDASSNLTWNSSTVPNRTHVISVKSFSAQGKLLGSRAVRVSVRNAKPTPTPTITPTPAPTSAAVIITTPGAGAHVEGTILFGAIDSASVQWTNFYVDGNYVASSPPSGILWDSTSVPAGAHTLSIKGFDASSNVIADPAITVTVDNVTIAPSASASVTSTPTPKPTVSGTPTSTPTARPTPDGDPSRPSNDIPNARVPSSVELAAFHIGVGACGGLDDCSYMQSVDGKFTATTAEIIEQVADKWCPDCTIVNPLDGQTYSFRDLLKAVAVNETHWYEWRTANLTSPDPITLMKTLTPSHGDLEHVTPTQPNGGSWGLFQIAEGVSEGWPASFPLSATSTGFNADFKTAEQMGVEQGHLSYLGDPDRSITAIGNGFAPYVDYTDAEGVLHPASSDVNQRRWGAVGNWYSGGWYDSGAIQYIDQVQQILHDQPWTLAGF